MLSWLALAALALQSQFAPQTYVGPGHYCGGGFLVRLDAGDSAVFRPPTIDMALIELRLGGHRITATSGPGGFSGKPVARLGGGELLQGSERGGVLYILDDGEPFALQITSPDFHGYARDRWFFDRVDFARGADKAVTCLEARR